jgi:hypothetical protein
MFQLGTTKEDAMSFARLIVIACILTTAPIRVIAVDLSLGGHMLGEKLSEFKRAFPTAVCGSPLHRAEATINPDIADKTQLLGCCLDDPRQISTFSTWAVLSVAHCHVFATFYQERLEELRYVVHVSAIEPLLPEFTKQFGVALLDQTVKFDSVHPNRVVAWSNGLDILSLVATKVRSDELTSESAHANDGLPEVNVVIVHLMRADK